MKLYRITYIDYSDQENILFLEALNRRKAQEIFRSQHPDKRLIRTTWMSEQYDDYVRNVRGS